MENKEILEKLTPIFQEAFNDDELEINESMTSDDFDNWDSVTQMLLVATIEKEFEIKFKLRELNTLTSVSAIVSAISSKF